MESFFEILEDNEEIRKKFHARGWGAEDGFINEEDIKALKEGKCLGYFDGEYTLIFKLIK